MPRSLTGRIVLVVVVPLVAAWLAMALALAVILASLHADVTKSTLAEPKLLDPAFYETAAVFFG